MTAQEEVKLSGVSDPHVNGSTSWYISTSACLVLLISTEETRVMSLLNDDKSDTRLIAHLQFHTCFTNSSQLIA